MIKKFDNGGSMPDKKINSIWDYPLDEIPSTAIMGIGRDFRNGKEDLLDGATNGQFGDIHSPGLTKEERENRRFLFGGTPQRTYLMPRDLQRRAFLEDGWIEGEPGDYGLVKETVGNRNLPVYQTAPDAIDREKLNVIANGDVFYLRPFPIRNGIDANFYNSGYSPIAYYLDGDGNLYGKEWDVNDYSGYGENRDTPYWMQALTGALDFVGSPTVITTGYQPIGINLYNIDPAKLNNFKTIPGYKRITIPIDKWLYDNKLHYEPADDGTYVLSHPGDSDELKGAKPGLGNLFTTLIENYFH